MAGAEVRRRRCRLRLRNPARQNILLGSQSASVAYPVFVEVTTRKVLDRDEFRRLCDAAKTRERIVNALER